MFLGKLIVGLLTAGACGLIIASVHDYQENVNSMILPCLVIFIIGFAIGSLIMVVYENTIDTIFLCF